MLMKFLRNFKHFFEVGELIRNLRNVAEIYRNLCEFLRNLWKYGIHNASSAIDKTSFQKQFFLLVNFFSSFGHYFLNSWSLFGPYFRQRSHKAHYFQYCLSLLALDIEAQHIDCHTK